MANLLFRGGASRSVTKQQIFDYIEVYYNRKRLHLNVDFRFPEAFKLKKVARQRAYEIGARSIFLIRKILQLGEANMPGEVRWWPQRRVDATEASQDGSAG